MTEPAGPQPPGSRAAGSLPGKDPDGSAGVSRPAASTRSASSRGRASALRRDRAERRKARTDLVVEAIAVAVLLLAVYVIATARPTPPASSAPPGQAYGPPISVSFGTPTVTSLACGGGGTAYAERIPWSSSTLPVTTADVDVSVYQIGDGDVVGDAGVVPSATPSDLCAGAAPSTSARWYAVLADPNGTNLVTYTYAQLWKSVTNTSWNIGIQNGSILTLVTNPSLAGTGYGFEVLGYENGSKILGRVPL